MDRTSFNTGSNTAHGAAAAGDTELLREIAESDVQMLHKADANGWLPLHEAVRAGHVETVKFLLQHGSDINVRTNDGKGGTPYWWAKKSLDEDHPIFELLKAEG